MADQGTQNHESFILPINVYANGPPDVPVHAQPTIGLTGMGYVHKASEPSWLEEVCIFVVSISTDDMLTCLQAPRILVCDLHEKYEKLKIDFSSTLLFLLSYLKV